MADPFAPIPARLDQQIRFADKTRIKEELRVLVRLVEDRLARLESFAPDWISVVEGITADQNQRLADSIGAQVDQITAWAEQAQQGAEDAQYAAAQAGSIDALSFVRRDGSQNFLAQASGVAPGAGARNNLLATAGWVGGEIDTATAANATADRAYADAAVAALNTALVGAAPASMNTIGELAGALNNSPSFATDTNTALGMRLRADTDQNLTATQRGQALRNVRRTPGYQTAGWTVTVDDMGRVFTYDATAAANLTLPTLATVGDGFYFTLRTINTNGRGGSVTLVRQGTNNIDGANANFIVPPGQTIQVVSDTVRGWQIVGRLRSALLYRADLPAGSPADLILPLANGYKRFTIMGQGLLKANNTAAIGQAMFSADGGSTYSTSYHRNFNYNSSATANTVGVALSTAAAVWSINGGSNFAPGMLRMDVEAGPGTTMGYSGQASAYSPTYGPISISFGGVATAFAAGSVIDTAKLNWGDADSMQGTFMVTGHW